MNRAGGELERKRQLAPPKHQPHLVRWVREFLVFATEHRGYTFEQTLDMFLAALGERTGVKPWQIRQATDAVRIFRYQYRTDSGKSGEGKPRKAWSDNEDDLLARMQEIICLRRYANSTEKTYLHWTRRFLAYRKHAGLAGEPTAADVKAFLTRLAMVEKVSASTQNQAFGALQKNSRVFLLGYVFLRKNGFRRQVENIETLFVGGDTRYGLGKISRVEWRELSGDSTVFGKTVHLDKEDPEIQSNIVWGHALGSSEDSSRIFGTKELLGGWDQGRGVRWQGPLVWIPGSCSKDELTWSINNNGCWICQAIESHTNTVVSYPWDQELKI